MTAGEARRDNGRFAAEYAAVGDVDPRVGEHLLDVLGLAGIAAYLRPSAEVNPITRSTSLPDRPKDRLYVDRAHLETALTHLAELDESDHPDSAPATDARPAVDSGPTAGTGPNAVTGPTASATLATDDERQSEEARRQDEAWQQIVAGYAAEATPPDRPNLAKSAGATGTPEADHSASTAYRGYDGSLLDGLDSFGANLPDPDEEGYTPPPAPPVPPLTRAAAFSIAGIVVGLACLLWPELVPILASSTVRLLGFGAVVAGVGTLVYRMRSGDDDDEEYDPDFGARV